MSIVSHIKEHAMLGLRGLSDNVITVGKNGRFSTLQAAINYAVAQPMYSEVAGNLVTLTLTQGGNAVTASGNLAFGPPAGGGFKDPYFHRWLSVDTAEPRKFYPVKGFSASNALGLACAFQEAGLTAVSGQYWTCAPLEQHIVLLDDVFEDVYISTDGTGGNGTQIKFLALRITRAAGSKLSTDVESATITLNAASGYLLLEGFKDADIIVTPRGGNFNPDTDARPVVQVLFRDIIRKSRSQFDFLYHGRLGGVHVDGCYLEGPYDIIIPHSGGDVSVRNSHLKATVRYSGDNESLPRGCGPSIFSNDGQVFCGEASVFEAICTGSNAVGVSTTFDASTYDSFASGYGSGHTFIFDDCSFVINGENGGTASPSFVGFLLRCQDSDIYFNNCKFLLVDEPASHAFNGFAGDGTAASAPNRLHFAGCAPWDLPNDLTTGGIAQVVEFKGSDGRPKALTFAAALAASELDLLRGDTFQVTLTGAVTSIPAVVNAPKGCRITFVFAQDGTGGHNVSGWDAAYRFHTAWSNTGNTAGTMSIVEFMSDGVGGWVQVGAANSWV